MTESTHLADAVHWAATEPRCANQAFNITNGDYFRWCNLWPKIAEVFEMPVATPRRSRSSRTCPTRRRSGTSSSSTRSQPYRYEELVAWPFGDYVFGCDWDVMTSTIKARQHGFHEVVDSEEMFVRLLGSSARNGSCRSGVFRPATMLSRR